MSNLSAQKKDSAKDQPQTKSASKPDTNRKNNPAQPAAKKPAATTGKKGTTPAKPATDKAKATRQPVVSGNRKTTVQKDSARKKDTAVKTAVRPGLKKDSAATKKTALKQDSAGAASLKKDSITKAAGPVPVHTRPHPPADSTLIKAAIADSLQKQAQLTKQERDFTRTQQILAGHPYYAFSAKPVITPYSKREKQPGEELYFYTLAGIMLLFAGFKTAFAKYFEDLITLFFRRTLKQRQLQQQLSQNTLPSFLFNILFVFTAGYYLALMAEQLANKQPYPFWQLFSFAAVFVSLAYLAKFFLLKLFGWLFKLQHLTDAYIFLIFLVNKILVLFLLPVIVVTSLGGTGIKTIIWTLSWLIIGALFLYRFTVAVQIVQKSNKVSLFHFCIYFIAFELLPAFVIYKFILHFLTGNSVPLHPI